MEPGGVTVSALYLLGELSRRGTDCHAIATLDASGPLAERFHAAGIGVHEVLRHGKAAYPLPYRAAKWLRAQARLTFGQRLARLLAHLKPDVVQSSVYHREVLAQQRAAHRIGARFILQIKTRDRSFTCGPHADRFIDRMQPGDQVVVVGESVARIHAAFLDRVPWLTIPNGVPDHGPVEAARRADLHRRLRVPPDVRLVGGIGRLVEHKHWHDLIDAAAGLDRVHVLLVGDGDARPYLLARAAAAGVTVHLPGETLDPFDWLNALDVFVLPSLSEGLPVSMLEAMARGLPIVAADVIGSRDLIDHGRTGLLVPLADPPALARALRRAWAAGDSLGQAARSAYVQHYTVGRVADAYQTLHA
ncbi:MAG: glycosyltransferase [Chloroflexi bacterium]|nr:glycosyltransferase [Chloroflexota bacterium]